MISAGDRLYLDSNVIIYAAEAPTVPFVDKLRDLLLRIDRGELRGVTSEFTLAEVLVKPIRAGDDRLRNFYQHRLTSSPTLEVAPVSRSVLLMAAQLRAQRSALKLPDAIHAATALTIPCDHFLTHDLRFGDVPGLSVVSLQSLPD